MEQRSDFWFEQRGGRFTASVASDLIADGRAKESIGESFYTLCKRVANERFFGIDTSWNVESWDMKRGTETEPEAFELLALMMRTGKVFKGEIIELDPCIDNDNGNRSFFPYGENAGASPDGIVLDSDIVAEIKCPRPEKVFELIKQNSVDAIDKKHYAQMQMQMLCTNSNRCVYFVYCVYKEKPVYHWIIVDRDESMIEKIKQRIELGESEVQKELEQLKANIKFEWK